MGPPTKTLRRSTRGHLDKLVEPHHVCSGAPVVAEAGCQGSWLRAGVLVVLDDLGQVSRWVHETLWPLEASPDPLVVPLPKHPLGQPGGREQVHIVRPA